MTGMSVVSASRRKTLWWNRVTFPQAFYRSTSDEKVLATLKGATMTAGVVGMVAGPYLAASSIFANATTLSQVYAGIGVMQQVRLASSVFLLTSHLISGAIESRVNLRPHHQIEAWPFADNQVGMIVPTTPLAFANDMAALAWRRFHAPPDSSMPSSQGSRIGISGQDDVYGIVEQDFLAPAERRLAVYHRKNVNGMGLLAPYPIAVSVEDDERTLRILQVTGGEPSPAAPELLPPGPAGQRDSPPE